ncbi:hypothetical protein AVEN_236530-1 [Araneus ventricosus]|uniref:Uncharacterized protein n=1 Tax=Araneus ventricosus TaxID=182803 RepID=A0A4Y2QWW6_ARAVE|nr:hypothetical protein AVEN_236530-1 [Araneus ventricosus]
MPGIYEHYMPSETCTFKLNGAVSTTGQNIKVILETFQIYSQFEELSASSHYPDSNFSLQQNCSKLALQICKLAARMTRQECKCETSLLQVNASFEVTTRRTCSKPATSNSLQTQQKQSTNTTSDWSSRPSAC